MNYQQTLDFLYSQLPMFSRMGSAAFKKDLTNIRILCERLGNPHTKFKSIHVGGTNGKGSVSHILAAIFQTAGYKSGLYTSPHLYDFRERIKVNGEMADKDFVVEFVEKVQPWIDEIQPSFFEITVAMAFEYFVQQKVDIAIIEVGLGGRLDSTNIITPELSIITNIGWDHMNMLGDSLDKIAFEKAGIIKQNIPVIIGEMLPETESVFKHIASDRNAELYDASYHFWPVQHKLENDLLHITYEQATKLSINVSTDLQGIYQLKNVATTLTAISILKQHWKIDQTSIEDGLRNVKKLTGLHGRWEVIYQHPTIVLEVAHNKNGIEQMLKHIGQLTFNQLHIIVGTVRDKDVDAILDLLPKNAAYYFTQASIPRALDKEELQTKAASFGLNGATYEDVNEALQIAKEKAAVNDLIIVCGSIFLVAEVNKDLIRQLS
jgi:dihydrofolate synthase / folylpolyglutamate synthase